MVAFTSIFLDFQLPNATTWFYFSLLLAVALFFKFTRFLSVRNWDVLTLFLLVPGLLLIQEARSLKAMYATRAVAAASQAMLPGASAFSAAGTLVSTSALAQTAPEPLLWY